MRRVLGAVVPMLVLSPTVASCATVGAQAWDVEVTVDELPPAPFGPREDHGLAWTGSQLLVWGGHGEGQHDSFSDGAAYSPETGAWRALADVDLEPRTRHSTVVVGDRMLVWGGFTPTHAGDEDAHLARDGALYDPEADSWEPVADAPEARDLARGVVVGEHVVFGGGSAPHGSAADFLVYSLEDDDWSTVALPFEPEPGFAVYDLAARGDAVVAVGGSPEGIVTIGFRPGDEAAAVREVPEAAETGGADVSAGVATAPGGPVLLALRGDESASVYEIDGLGRAELVDRRDSTDFRPPVSHATGGLIRGDMHVLDGLGLLATGPGEFSLWDPEGERSHRARTGALSDYCGPLVPVADDALLGWGGRGCGSAGVSVGVDA
ncbi:Kelch repeat-containing protein [Nocardiopsis lucentensis]|uniref:Kelch repeat-containing protein n=1 Tax=Nocardiopsis lucentensis TaxID=53441 RepID=UPI00034D686B|nr:kelch repeat-containing protein [Nocardiopsis lucentensis]